MARKNQTSAPEPLGTDPLRAAAQSLFETGGDGQVDAAMEAYRAQQDAGLKEAFSNGLYDRQTWSSDKKYGNDFGPNAAAIFTPREVIDCLRHVAGDDMASFAARKHAQNPHENVSLKVPTMKDARIVNVYADAGSVSQSDSFLTATIEIRPRLNLLPDWAQQKVQAWRSGLMKEMQSSGVVGAEKLEALPLAFQFHTTLKNVREQQQTVSPDVEGVARASAVYGMGVVARDLSAERVREYVAREQQAYVDGAVQNRGLPKLASHTGRKLLRQSSREAIPSIEEAPTLHAILTEDRYADKQELRDVAMREGRTLMLKEMTGISRGATVSLGSYRLEQLCARALGVPSRAWALGEQYNGTATKPMAESWKTGATLPVRQEDGSLAAAPGDALHQMRRSLVPDLGISNLGMIRAVVRAGYDANVKRESMITAARATGADRGR